MGKEYVTRFSDGNSRTLASFSMNRARLFYEITKIIENYVELPSGIEDDNGIDEYEINADKFVVFFEQFWRLGWIADNEDSFVDGWSSWAAGIVENIILKPVSWIDRKGNELQIRHYQLSEKNLEQELERKRENGEVEVKKSEINNTDITV